MNKSGNGGNAAWRRGRGRPASVYRITTPDGDVQKLTGASLVALVLGVKKQTVYNSASSGKTVAGCRIQKEETR